MLGDFFIHQELSTINAILIQKCNTEAFIDENNNIHTILREENPLLFS